MMSKIADIGGVVFSLVLGLSILILTIGVN